MKKILLASDLSERSDHALARAHMLAAAAGGEVTALYVASADLPAAIHEQLRRAADVALKAQIARVCPVASSPIHASVQPGRDWSTIIEVAELGGFDLIALGLHRMDRVGYRLGSTVERLVSHTGVPLLVVPQAPRGAYRRPLVAVDFSLPSRRAVKLARALAPDAPVAAVHAWDLPLRGFFTSEAARHDAEAGQSRRLEALIAQEFAELAATDPDTHARLEPVLRRGEPAAVIEAEANARKADLLVLGSHGDGGFGTATAGAVATTFLKLPPCDVAVVKAW